MKLHNSSNSLISGDERKKQLFAVRKVKYDKKLKDRLMEAANLVAVRTSTLTRSSDLSKIHQMSRREDPRLNQR